MSSASKIWIIALCICSSPCWGLDSDRKKPINIKADRITVVEKKGYSRYQGNVILTQGTLKVTGDDLTVFTKQNKLNKAIVVGQPATLVQLPEGQTEPVHTRANEMEYRVDQQKVYLSGKAEVWQGPNRFTGEKISYNISDGTVTGEKGMDDNGRVSITIMPPDNEAEGESKP